MAGPAPRRLAAAVAAALGPGRDLVVVPAGPAVVVAVDPVERRVVERADAAALRALRPGWWAGVLGYELGRPPSTRRAFPDLTLARFDARVEIGPTRVRVIGRGEAAGALRAALAGLEGVGLGDLGRAPLGLGPWASDVSFPEWATRVRRVHTWLRAGETYQLNLTRTLHAEGAVDPVSVFARVARRHDVPYAGVVRIGPHAVVSASPECFLRWRGRAVTTRPIKGTARDAPTLVASEKDRVENVMIVDLARADLDRVCEPGSVRVRGLLDAETHPGLVHLVSTVVGTRREHADVADLLVAAFPPASITGVPKPRVLDLIEHVEQRPRGAYCGAVGWFDNEHDAGELAVAIRTFTCHARHVELGVGGGITIASDAAAEWAETELKAERLLALFDAPVPAT